MKRTVLIFAVLIAGFAAAATTSTAPFSAATRSTAPYAAAPMEPFVGLLPDSLSWGGAPDGLPAGSRAAVLEGDPSKAGDFFTLRLRAPAGYKIMPHTHPTAERVTVLEGTLYLGMGDKWDDAALKAYPAGSYVSLPVGHRHYALFKESGLVQLSGLGPWGITYVDPKDDPRGKK